MIYLKSYCYSQHELPFVITNLMEGWNHIDLLCLYEYNYTYSGTKKSYEFEKVLHLIPENLKTKLYYKKVDITNYTDLNCSDDNKISRGNVPIQRSWFFNDSSLNLQDDDIIIDHDIDEIIYNYSYESLIKELNQQNRPLSIRLNQFFFKQNYFWYDCPFTSPTIYKYCMVKNNVKKIKGIKIQNLRNLQNKTSQIYGCHMSWVMSAELMVTKLYSYDHPKYRKYADKKLLQEAIDNKVYIFDTNKSFNIKELDLNDKRIPIYLQKNNIFDYM